MRSISVKWVWEISKISLYRAFIADFTGLHACGCSEILFHIYFDDQQLFYRSCSAVLVLWPLYACMPHPGYLSTGAKCFFLVSFSPVFFSDCQVLPLSFHGCLGTVGFDRGVIQVKKLERSCFCRTDLTLTIWKNTCRIASSYLTLLWSLFSITKIEDTNVIEEHYVTQFVGSAMFITYHMTSIIVLLNMLIAMMSHSFQRVNVRFFINLRTCTETENWNRTEESCAQISN